MAASIRSFLLFCVVVTWAVVLGSSHSHDHGHSHDKPASFKYSKEVNEAAAAAAQGPEKTVEHDHGHHSHDHSHDHGHHSHDHSHDHHGHSHEPSTDNDRSHDDHHGHSHDNHGHSHGHKERSFDDKAPHGMKYLIATMHVICNEFVAQCLEKKIDLYTLAERDLGMLWIKALGATALISVTPIFILFLIPVQDANEKHQPLLKVLLAFASGGLLG